MELIKESKLINENSTQNDQTNTIQTLYRNLTTPLEHVLEQAIERFNRLRA